MKKLFFILLAVGVMSACNTKKAEPQPDPAAPVTLEADVEQALQKNIELNEQVTTLDEELEAIINEQ
jgi:cell division protein FtsB